MAVGLEGRVTVWTGLDSDTIHVEERLDFNEPVTTVAMSSRGPLLALGFRPGSLELAPTLDGIIDADFPLFCGEIHKNRDQKKFLKLVKERKGLEEREALKDKVKTAGGEDSVAKVALREKRSRNLWLLTKLSQREEIILSEKQRDELQQRAFPDLKS